MHQMLLGRQQKSGRGKAAMVIVFPKAAFFGIYDKKKRTEGELARSQVSLLVHRLKLPEKLSVTDTVSFRGNIDRDLLIKNAKLFYPEIDQIVEGKPPAYYLRYGDAIARYALIQNEVWPREPGKLPNVKGPFDADRAFLIHGVISDGRLSYSVINIVQYGRIMWRVKRAEQDPLTLSLIHLRGIFEDRSFARDFDFWTANPVVHTVLEGQPPPLSEDQQRAFSDFLSTHTRLEYTGTFGEPQEPLLSLLRIQLRDQIQHFVRQQ